MKLFSKKNAAATLKCSFINCTLQRCIFRMTVNAEQIFIVDLQKQNEYLKWMRQYLEAAKYL